MFKLLFPHEVEALHRSVMAHSEVQISTTFEMIQRYHCRLFCNRYFSLAALTATGCVLLQMEKEECKGKNSSVLNASSALKVCCQNWPGISFSVGRVWSPQIWSCCLISVCLDYVKLCTCFLYIQSTIRLSMAQFPKTGWIKTIGISVYGYLHSRTFWTINSGSAEGKSWLWLLTQLWLPDTLKQFHLSEYFCCLSTVWWQRSSIP